MKAAQLVVISLEAQGVEVIFGIPGAKIDAVFDALEDSPIRLIVCRHEQNAAFMAAAYGRLTGKPGVVLVTSGPGVANLSTGLLTATTEGDPVIAIGGNVPRSVHLREAHQNVNNSKLLETVTKSSVEVTSVDTIPEAISNAFREALGLRRGACFISLPQDVLAEETAIKPIKKLSPPIYAAAASSLIKNAADLMNEANVPVMLLGQEASRPENAKAIRALLSETPYPVVGTYQAAGVIPRQLETCFVGRVGLFKNQPGDVLLDEADVIMTVGFNPAEYDPEVWNKSGNAKIINIDYQAANIHNSFVPAIELLGEIHNTISQIAKQLKPRKTLHDIPKVKELHDALYETIESGKNYTKDIMHPLRFIYELRHALNDDAFVVCDIGSVYMWMARYFLSYEPHHLLFSNGQQTLGVALPWAMATRLTHPDNPIVSISGDGGFLFSAMELETAVREKLHFVHCVWTDGAYNMVLEQEIMKYKRKSGVDFGHVNLVDFASAFGAKGYRLESSDDFSELLKEALKQKQPVLIDIPIDYSDNPKLFAEANPYAGN